MAQSALTVTTANPTPPTNLIYVGNTPSLDYLQPAVDDGIPAAVPNSKLLTPANGHTVNETESQTWPVGITFATSTAATNTASPPAVAGAPGAGVSNTHEARGTETSVTAASGNPSLLGQNRMVGVGPALTAAIIAAGPNASHASTMSPTTNPVFNSLAVAGGTVSGTGTAVLTCTGVGFVPGCRIWVNNVEQNTTFGNSTTLTATINKKREAGNWLVDVKLGGVPVASQRTITWT
jgi:hypothetical protein